MPRPGEGTTLQGTWGDWLSPVAAFERVLQAWVPRPSPVVDVPLLHAVGRILAVEIRAPLDSPPFDRSTVDGYAVRAASVDAATPDAPVLLRVVGTIDAGATPTVTIHDGDAVWVATGAPLPAGADGVVMVERTHSDGDAVSIDYGIAAGENVTPRGGDVRAGCVVLRAGRRLRPQDVSILASMGIAQIPVRVRPRVAIICSGDELVEPGESLGAARIYDANGYAIAAQIAAWGGEPVVPPRVKDRREEIQRAFGQALDTASIVLLSGGSSIGVKDYTAAVIQELGEPGVLVHGVAMRPGRPTSLGVVRDALVVGIPGNPVTAMIAAEVFVRPALELLLAIDPPRRAGEVGDVGIVGRLAAPIRSLSGRQDYVRVRLDHDPSGAVSVHEVAGGSGIISSMVDADGLVVVPPTRSECQAGEMVEVRLFS